MAKEKQGSRISHEIFKSIHVSNLFKIQTVEISEDNFVISSITEDIL